MLWRTASALGRSRQSRSQLSGSRVAIARPYHHIRMNVRTIDELLTAARSRLTRLDPHEAAAAVRDGALLIDIRAESQRAEDGVVPGAMFVARNVLEWRCDPSSEHRDPR